MASFLSGLFLYFELSEIMEFLLECFQDAEIFNQYLIGLLKELLECLKFVTFCEKKKGKNDYESLMLQIQLEII